MTSSSKPEKSDQPILWLTSVGLRPTRQRRDLARLILKGGERHLTAEALFAEAQAAKVDVSLATIYNALRQFTEAGLLREIPIDAARSYYDTRLNDHPHFFWEETGEIEDAPPDSVLIARLPEPPQGAKLARVDVILRLRREG
ncbi:iron response transcriptional regulator IrrA [Neomegalonema perideroedes]|uniref:iron response transcriptional regulator IrrA n=1 Tax=Neomegalonema perideroedes TaxID=217219 RepID=UPI00037C6A54|nr:Fur family transcriptional regulator [Neomegalonema perideroedes]